MNDVIAQILSEDNTENIILYNNQGQAVEFEQIAVIDLDLEGTYVILHPAAPVDGMSEDEALVFCVGEDELEVERDDAIIDLVFAEYYRMLEEEGVI